jgi:uncharacterized protein YcnI
LLRTAFIASALTLALVSAAQAHIVFAEPEAAPNSYYCGFLRVSHGCGASPTRAIRVEIPDGINIARPQPKPGWRLSIERAPLASPTRSEGGEEITERVSAITWTGELPADQFDQFGIMMRLPDQTEPLYFRVTQTCLSGEQRWDEIPPAGAAWHSVPHPAPVLMLLAPQAAEEDHGATRRTIVIGTLFAAVSRGRRDERAADIQATKALMRATGIVQMRRWRRWDGTALIERRLQFRAADRPLRTGLSLFTLR